MPFTTRAPTAAARLLHASSTASGRPASRGLAVLAAAATRRLARPAVMPTTTLALSRAVGTTPTSGARPTGPGLEVIDPVPRPKGPPPKKVPPTPTSRATSKSFVGMSGGQIFHEMMLQHGVDTVFGYPGGAILPVYDAIHNSPYFNFILPRHEQGAGHMAEGYARATGKPGVVLVTSGPGATNVITPMQDALSDGTPMVVFTGQVVTAAIGSDAFQEADVLGISRACTKWNVMVKDISELPKAINQAFKIATSGRPGPVLVDLPKDVTAGILRAEPAGGIEPSIPYRPTQTRASSVSYEQFQAAERQKTLANIAKLTNAARKPVLYVGAGILNHPDGPAVLREVAHRGNLPVTTTLQGLGAFDEEDPLSLHMLGMHGSAYANLAMQSADVIIALGARFDDRVTGILNKFAPAAKKAARQGKGGIFHFEIMPKNIDKIVEATDAVEGDVTENLKQLLPMLEHRDRHPWFNQLDEWREKYPFSFEPAPPGAKIKPQQVIAELNRQLADRKDEVIITTGVGQHQMWAAQYYRWRHPRSWISSGGLGTMGFGLPSAIGAKVACPEKMVIDIDGDASFSMTAMEMQTARQYNIGVKALVLNNDFQGMVKQWQDLFYDKRYSGTTMTNPDFVKLAEAMGCEGIRVKNAEDLPAAIERFIATTEPVLLEVVVEKDEHVYPMVPAGKALHEMELGHVKLTEPDTNAFVQSYAAP